MSDLTLSFIIAGIVILSLIGLVIYAITRNWSFSSDSTGITVVVENKPRTMLNKLQKRINRAEQLNNIWGGHDAEDIVPPLVVLVPTDSRTDARFTREVSLRRDIYSLIPETRRNDQSIREDEETLRELRRAFGINDKNRENINNKEN